LIALDTNVLVRAITEDDPQQAPKAIALIRSLTGENPAYLTVVVIVELAWVLSRAYKRPREEIMRVLDRILRNRAFIVQDYESIWSALRRYGSTTADFADCLIAAEAARKQCEYVLTFDRAAVASGEMRLLG
jgi:predicted nucleic-acid-binding protein